MVLSLYIENVGVSVIARNIGLSKSTVSNWKLLKSAPLPMQAHLLIKYSGGLLTLESIYRPYINAQLKLKKA